MTKQKLKTRVIVILLSSMLILFICCALLYYSTYQEANRWRELTTPLEPEVIRDLCEQFSISSEDPLCKEGAVVYSLDFAVEIERKFQPIDGEWATYEEVEEKIGKFKEFCEEPEINDDGIEYFSCSYDLRGDGWFPIAIDFNNNDRHVMELRWSREWP